MISEGFYRRPLPEQLVGFSSAEGRALFREALEAGTLEGFFALAEQFHTQAEPAYCGLGSLVVALNALGIDPGRLWRGPWRWFGEELLDCCVPLEVVKARGLTLGELACLAQCNGATSRVVRATNASVDVLRDAVASASRAEAGVVIVASYDRSRLGQTGAGHFSPIGGYHAGRDLALVLDVARFKYPPHWVPLERLFEAMQVPDPDTGTARGWVSLTPDDRPRPLLVRFGRPALATRPDLASLARFVAGARARDAEAIVRDIGAETHELAPLLDGLGSSLGGDLAPEHRDRADAIVRGVQATRAHQLATEVLGRRAVETPLTAVAVAVLALAFAGDPSEPIGGALAEEIEALKRQLGALCAGEGAA
jgi:glutathione gamma-glutamylcysteinyltransferase